MDSHSALVMNNVNNTFPSEEKPLGTFRASRISLIIAWGLISVVAILRFFSRWLVPISDLQRVSSIFLLLLLLAGLLVIAVYVLHPFIPGYPNHVMTVYQDHFSYFDGKTTVSYPWNEVDVFLPYVPSKYFAFDFIFNYRSRFNITILMQDERQFTFDLMIYERHLELATVLAEIIPRVQLPIIRDELGAGQTIYFGSYAFSAQGLQPEPASTLIGWDNVIGLDVQDNAIQLHCRVQANPPITLELLLADVPNALVIPDLLEHFAHNLERAST